MDQVLIKKVSMLEYGDGSKVVYVTVACDEDREYYWCVTEGDTWKIYNTTRMEIRPDVEVIYGPFYLKSQAIHHLKEKFGVAPEENYDEAD
jgi:hypothetical protein